MYAASSSLRHKVKCSNVYENEMVIDYCHFFSIQYRQDYSIVVYFIHYRADIYHFSSCITGPNTNLVLGTPF